MGLIRDPAQVEETFSELAAAAEPGVVLATFGVENPWAVEAALMAGAELGEELGRPDIPLILSFTGRYRPRRQLDNYTATGLATVGAPALFRHLEVLTGDGSPWGKLRVIAQFDHMQPEADADLVDLATDFCGLICYDGSALSLDENVRRTARFVEEVKGKVLVEGVPEEPSSRLRPGEEGAAEQAARFVSETGCFLVAPNLGTEHRAEAGTARYMPELARSISKAGVRIALHGTSSLITSFASAHIESDLERLASDGVAKANFWTGIERAGCAGAASFIAQKLGTILPEEKLQDLREKGFLGPEAGTDHFLECATTASWRQAWARGAGGLMKRVALALGYGRLAMG